MAKLSLRLPLFFGGATAGVRHGMVCYRTVDVSAAVAPIRWGSRFIASVVVVNSPQSYDGLPRGRWPSENMPCKFDEILHFKSNSSPEAVCLPGYYPDLL